MTEADLLAAIAEQPDDQTRLVYADWLIARGDRRGELIVLDHRERTTPGGLTHPDALAALLRLAAEFGFPHLPDPDGDMLPFEQATNFDHHYRLVHDTHAYTVRCDIGRIRITIDDVAVDRAGIHRKWTDQETNVILSIISRAIRGGTPLHTLAFPAGTSMRAHPDHRLGPLPMYFSAEVVEDFDRDWLLRARDHTRWYELYDRLVAGYSATSHRW